MYRKPAVPNAAHWCIDGCRETEMTRSDSRTACWDGVVITEVW